MAPTKILLQTTIPPTVDDWDSRRFSLLAEYLQGLPEHPFEVTARDRAINAEGDDPVISTLDESDFDELWLFAVDNGTGLTRKDSAGINRFRNRGGGVLTTRDHEDLGSCLCDVVGVGEAHHFHSRNPEPDPSRHCIDDPYSKSVSWPNYHSGRNGDFQTITVLDPIHELLLADDCPDGRIRRFPAHPHEGAVGVPASAPDARVIALGTSKVTQRPFNLAVVFDRNDEAGRGIAESSFHHFVDYNWDISKGAPSFVGEPEGDGYRKDPAALKEIQAYVRNVAHWLAPGR